ncbi:MAG: ferritin family protein [Gammaproteobacteria bacterium]|nr:ferritin family protein [Gammaproteobacteria bacterium]
MTAIPNLIIETLPEFLLHAITLERESVERYEELGDSMEVHNNPQIAAVFRKLARYGELHANEIEQHATGLELPRIPPWDFKWTTPESPETGDMEQLHYLMTQGQALIFALHNETQGRDFYAHVAATSTNQEVRELAAEFAEEETDHMNWLNAWIRNLADPDSVSPEDLDPPNVTE